MRTPRVYAMSVRLVGDDAVVRDGNPLVVAVAIVAAVRLAVSIARIEVEVRHQPGGVARWIGVHVGQDLILRPRDAPHLDLVDEAGPGERDAVAQDRCATAVGARGALDELAVEV